MILSLTLFVSFVKNIRSSVLPLIKKKRENSHIGILHAAAACNLM